MATAQGAGDGGLPRDLEGQQNFKHLQLQKGEESWGSPPSVSAEGEAGQEEGPRPHGDVRWEARCCTQAVPALSLARGTLSPPRPQGAVWKGGSARQGACPEDDP